MVKRADKGMSGGRQNPESDHPDWLSRRTADVVGQLFRTGKPRPHARGNTRAQLGQYHASPGALKQTAAAVLLELDNLAADMRLTGPVSHGNLAQAPEFCRVDK